jgi:hypothetical protein
MGVYVTKTERAVYMQVNMMYYLIKRWGKTFEEFFELDAKYGILHFLRIGYEPFHLTGDEGIAMEVESYIKERGGAF